RWPACFHAHPVEQLSLAGLVFSWRRDHFQAPEERQDICRLGGGYDTTKIICSLCSDRHCCKCSAHLERIFCLTRQRIWRTLVDNQPTVLQHLQPERIVALVESDSLPIFTGHALDSPCRFAFHRISGREE